MLQAHLYQALDLLPEHDRTAVYLHDTIANLAVDLGFMGIAAHHFLLTVQGLLANDIAVESPQFIEVSLKLAECMDASGKSEDTRVCIWECGAPASMHTDGPRVVCANMSKGAGQDHGG